MMDKLTDFELNKEIVEALGFIVTSQPYCGSVIAIHNGNSMRLRFVDYCNNYNDLVALLIQYLISIEIYKNRVIAKDCMFGIEVDKLFYEGLEGDLPLLEKQRIVLRAGAECLLKVLQEKQGDE